MFPELKRLTLEDRPALLPLLAQAPQPTCDYSFASLYIWQDCEVPSYAMLDGSLCILLEPRGALPYFLQPLGGDKSLETFRACLERSGRVSRAGESLVSRLDSREFRIVPLRDNSDYLYRLSDLASLEGKKYDGKRNQINKFTRNHPDFEFRKLTELDLEPALKVFATWARDREKAGAQALEPDLSVECQTKVLKRAFEGYRGLGMIGGGIFVGGELKGFSIGSELNPKTAVIHIQYADASLPGIYQAVLWQACRNLFQGYELINLEEDLGIPGLRKTKLSYHPLCIEPKFKITLRPAAQEI